MTIIETPCAECGKSVRVKPYLMKRLKRHFCDWQCLAAYRQHTVMYWPPRKRVQVICAICGTTFSRTPSTVRQTNLCGYNCWMKWMAGRGKPGSSNPSWRGGHPYYRGPNWRRQRTKAMSRDGHRCLRCGHQFGLRVHHIRPFSLFEDYREANALDNLRTLCNKCHGVEEAAFWKANPTLWNTFSHLIPAPIACARCGRDFIPGSGAAKICWACKTTICRHCGKTFTSRKARPAVYCSRKCRNDHVRVKPHKCLGCGKEFTPRFNKRQYCSVHCHNINVNPRRRFFAKQRLAAQLSNPTAADT